MRDAYDLFLIFWYSRYQKCAVNSSNWMIANSVLNFVFFFENRCGSCRSRWENFYNLTTIFMNILQFRFWTEFLIYFILNLYWKKTNTLLNLNEPNDRENDYNQEFIVYFQCLFYLLFWAINETSFVYIRVLNKSICLNVLRS